MSTFAVNALIGNNNNWLIFIFCKSSSSSSSSSDLGLEDEDEDEDEKEERDDAEPTVVRMDCLVGCMCDIVYVNS